MLNGKQQSIFRPLVDRAWLAYCSRRPAGNVNSREDRAAWYRKVLVQELGVYSTKEIQPDDQDRFDTLCLVFATISGDQAQIDYWSRAPERRAMWRLESTMRNARVDWAYVRGIARNMNLGDRPIEDLPAELILKLNTAVFKYLKRKEKKNACA